MVRNWDSGIRPTLKLNTSELMYDANFTVSIAKSEK